MPWPQNHVLAGTSKCRVTYDSLSTFQQFLDFVQSVKMKKNVSTKYAMLEDMSELMEDDQDFRSPWSSAKDAHAVLLCRMEEGKVNWNMTEKIARIRVHAQKVVNASSKKLNPESQGMPCKFYQKQKCPYKGDHHTGGQF